MASISPPPTTEIRSWDDLNLKPDLLRGIYSFGFETPSEIQKKTIPYFVQGTDMIAQAQSGSGKTGSFTIGMLQSIDTATNELQAIILAPTHELAKQISNVISHIGSFLQPEIHVQTLIGGTSIRDDVALMHEKPPHVIVGCVGRIFDLFARRQLSAVHLKMLILDEADEMLSKGFVEKIRDMFHHFLPETIQVVLFSATMPPDILSLTQRFLRDPVKIVMKPEELNLKCIQQFFVAVTNDLAKFDTLKDIFSMISVSKCIIYCNSVNRVQDLFSGMQKDGFSVCCIHSLMPKVERDKIFQQFRHEGYRVLISSDLTARGIDIQQVSTVINYDIPNSPHTYLHRIGRSGRWGRKGFAINFVNKYDIGQLKNFEQYYQIDIRELPASFMSIV